MNACTKNKQEEKNDRKLCVSLAQENVMVYNSDGFKICNLWYEYIPMTVC